MTGVVRIPLSALNDPILRTSPREGLSRLRSTCDGSWNEQLEGRCRAACSPDGVLSGSVCFASHDAIILHSLLDLGYSRFSCFCGIELHLIDPGVPPGLGGHW